MWSRWDMQEAPPDILITNYSMLNIMLMRSLEGNIFDGTAQWLREDRRHLFHLVVDELHSYRGTPGTEVGYLLRALLDRLGLEPDSSQLRLISTSASIEDDAESRLYLQQFFGRDHSSFDVVPGARRHFEASPSWPLAVRIPAHRARQLLRRAATRPSGQYLRHSRRRHADGRRRTGSRRIPQTHPCLGNPCDWQECSAPSRLSNSRPACSRISPTNIRRPQRDSSGH